MATSSAGSSLSPEETVVNPLSPDLLKTSKFEQAQTNETQLVVTQQELLSCLDGPRTAIGIDDACEMRDSTDDGCTAPDYSSPSSTKGNDMSEDNGTQIDCGLSPSSGSQFSSVDDISPTRRALADGFLHRKLEILARSNTSKGFEARSQLRKLQSGEQSKINFTSDDDPFGPGIHPSALISPKTLSSKSTQAKSSPGALADEQSNDPTGTPTRSGRRSSNSGLGSGKAESDSTKAEISADNAQAMLPPSSCVFVANLAQTRTDDELEASVKRVFQKFGTVYVKIRRDIKGMPFAFCQYENDHDAQRAIALGRRSLIDGRPCRTEPARVNRSLYMSRHIGGTISEVEARGILHNFGPIENMWHSSPTDMELYQLPEGIWVKFAYYQDCRDAQSEFRDNSIYRLEQPSVISDGTTQSARNRMTFMSRKSAQKAGARTDQRFVRQIGSRHAIFIGNLPLKATNKDLFERFRRYGTISEVSLIHRIGIHNDSQATVFAFIDFLNEQAAFSAVQSENTMLFNGVPMRVEMKESVDFVNRRYNNGPVVFPLTPYRTPDRIVDAQSRNKDLTGRRVAGVLQNKFQTDSVFVPSTPSQLYTSGAGYTDLAPSASTNRFNNSPLSTLDSAATSTSYRFRHQGTPLTRTPHGSSQSNGAHVGAMTNFIAPQGYLGYYPPPTLDFSGAMMHLNLQQTNSGNQLYWTPQPVEQPDAEERREHEDGRGSLQNDRSSSPSQTSPN